jgi:HAD superfamily hydrolase (TIGR01509 family)
MLRLVLFDWGGVLTEGDYDRQVSRELAERNGLDPEEVFRVWREGRRLAFERGGTSLEDVWEELAARFGLRGAAEDFAALLRSAITPHTAVIDLLTPLRCRAALALLSNNYPPVSALVKKSLASYFDRLFFSDETGRVKPDPAAYLQVLESMQVRAGDTLVVDDRERNLAPARALGMAVHHFQRASLLRAELVAAGLLVA